MYTRERTPSYGGYRYLVNWKGINGRSFWRYGSNGCDRTVSTITNCGKWPTSCWYSPTSRHISRCLQEYHHIEVIVNWKGINGRIFEIWKQRLIVVIVMGGETTNFYFDNTIFLPVYYLK